MAETPFCLGTFSMAGAAPFVGVVLDERVIPAHALFEVPSSPFGVHATMVDVLDDWDRNFDRLREAVAKLEDGAGRGVSAPHAFALSQLRVMPPVLRPSKILNAAANYSGHLSEMRAYTQTGGDVAAEKVFAGDKSKAAAYLFLKAPSSLAGAYDDIELPDGAHHVDWEAELAVVIGRKARRISASAAMEHVAGFMTFNDVSCRTLLFREDRPNFRTDWLSSKSLDTFGPCGPFLVPRAFVPNHAELEIELTLNGEIRQKGLAGDMIYAPEEQIEYAASMMTLDPGDIFATGTVAGVGQGAGVFLKAGDVVETEVKGLGRQRNKVVHRRE